MEQWRDCPPTPNSAYTCSEPLQSSTLQQIAKQGLKDAADLQSFICVDRRPDEILQGLSDWWSKAGHKLMTSDCGVTLGQLQAEEEELFCIEEDVTLMDVPPSDVLPPSENGMDTASALLAAEDRVSMMVESTVGGEEFLSLNQAFV